MAMAYTDTVIGQANEAPHLITSGPQPPPYQECIYMDVSLMHHTTLVHPTFKLAPRRSTPTSSPVSRPMSCRSTSPFLPLPDEIFAQIAQYALGNPFDNLDVARPAPEYRKPAFGNMDGMTRASRRLRAISLPEWFRLFIVNRADDWERARRLSGMHSWVRHIICPAKALDLPTPEDVLARFPYLRSASLALSRDYHFTPILPLSRESLYPSAPATLEITPGFNYRQPVSSFPPTMTSLSVRGTHGSETPLLRNLGLQCPDLRVLRLAKCTMFDSCTKACGAKSNGSRHTDRYRQLGDGSDCSFWGTFPFSHDIYFGGENVEAYADELAAELAPLQNLEEVSVGVYLTPNAALTEHRLAHYPLRHLPDDDPLIQNLIAAASPNLSQPPILLPSQSTAVIEQPPAPHIPPPVTTAVPWSTSQVPPPQYTDPSLWSYDCHACRKIYTASTTTAEHTAGLVLASALPRLKKIEWASFFESHPHAHEFERGTGMHEWRVVRDACGAVLDVERVFC
ncbi:F-box-like domain protein [Ceratobasidium sp. AG-Ba]|nr:F-box-like domain protein [Ceratobasidium sp. AG-Ba]